MTGYSTQFCGASPATYLGGRVFYAYCQVTWPVSITSFAGRAIVTDERPRGLSQKGRAAVWRKQPRLAHGACNSKGSSRTRPIAVCHAKQSPPSRHGDGGLLDRVGSWKRAYSPGMLPLPWPARPPETSSVASAASSWGNNRFRTIAIRAAGKIPEVARTLTVSGRYCSA